MNNKTEPLLQNDEIRRVFELVVEQRKVRLSELLGQLQLPVGHRDANSHEAADLKVRAKADLEQLERARLIAVRRSDLLDDLNVYYVTAHGLAAARSTRT